MGGRFTCDGGSLVQRDHSAGAVLLVLIDQLTGGGAKFRLCCGSECPPSTHPQTAVRSLDPLRARGHSMALDERNKA